jgi:hypothetical protein
MDVNKAPALVEGVRSWLFNRAHGVVWVVIDKAVVAYSCVALWISLSAGVILFNKYILSSFGFPYPVALTLMHMGFCSGPIAAPSRFAHHFRPSFVTYHASGSAGPSRDKSLRSGARATTLELESHLRQTHIRVSAYGVCSQRWRWWWCVG